MGFNRRKLEDQRRGAAEKEAANRRATDAQVLEDAERLIAARNERQAKRMPMLFSETPGCCRASQTNAAPDVVLDRHANEYKSRSRRDDDGGGDGDDGGGDDASNAVGQRGNSGDDGGGGDDGDGSNPARPVLRRASLPRRSARHPSSTHSVHRELAPEDRDNWSVACFV